jgi:hypothetical protein
MRHIWKTSDRDTRWADRRSAGALAPHRTKNRTKTLDRSSSAVSSRSAEFGALPRQLASLSNATLRANYRAFVQRHCPWLEDAFVIGGMRA